MKKVNPNDMVKVKLTQIGIDIYHQLDEINKEIMKQGGKQIEAPIPKIE